MHDTATRPTSVPADMGPTWSPRPEASRARYPDETGFIERDGVRVFWERYGHGSPTILLMPTWSVLHSRHWKLQIPYLARHFRVVTFDGRGNGRSDRPPGVAAYADTEFVADAVAVLDATGTDRAVAAGLSMGAGYAVRLAADHPDRVLGLVLFGAAIDVVERLDVVPPDGDDRDDSFEEPALDDEGWSKYNAHFWRRDWAGFAEWFAGEVMYSEPHSTKQVEDSVGWFLETDPETIIATERAPYLQVAADRGPSEPTEGPAIPFVRAVRCPTLVVHGTDDRIIRIDIARILAAELGSPLVEIGGGGHVPIGREPVRANLLIRDFVATIQPSVGRRTG